MFINKSHIKKSVTQIPHKYPASEKSHNNQTTLTICIRLKAVYIVYVTKEFKFLNNMSEKGHTNNLS